MGGDLFLILLEREAQTTRALESDRHGTLRAFFLDLVLLFGWRLSVCIRSILMEDP